MKTKEELKQIKEEVEKMNTALAELTDEELKTVNGGNFTMSYVKQGTTYEISSTSNDGNCRKEVTILQSSNGGYCASASYDSICVGCCYNKGIYSK